MAERKKIGFGTILMVILAVCVVAYVVSTMRTAGDIPYSELRQYFLEEKVQEFSISDTRITAKLKGGSTVTSDLYDFDLFYQDLNELVQKPSCTGKTPASPPRSPFCGTRARQDTTPIPVRSVRRRRSAPAQDRSRRG